MGFSVNGKLDPKLDISGAFTLQSNRTLTDESSGLGPLLAGQTGAAASIVAGAGAGQVRVSGLTGMVAESRHRFLTISGAASPGNNGTFLISAYVGATSVDIVNAAGVTGDANNGAISWVERDPFTLEDHINFELTDRAAIKGVAYDAAIPTYTRPDATGTSVPANLSNIASKTTDAKALVNDIRQNAIALRPGISGTAAGAGGGAGNVVAADDTFTSDAMNFVAGDVGSFLLLNFNGTATHGGGSLLYRITAVTDGETLELEGLGTDVTGSGTVSWTLLSDQKTIVSSQNHADSVNTLGIPIADSGAYDELNYSATFADVINPITNGGISDEAGNRIFARAFGIAKDPNGTTADGVRFYVQLLTGLNDGTATDEDLEIISGRSGAAASVTNASTTVTGLSGMESEDVGKYLTLFGCAVDGNQRHARITAVLSDTSVQVAGANFATDGNSGAIRWQVSRHAGSFDFYTPQRERFDQMNETRGRGLLIGGIVSDAELTLDVLQTRNTIGISDNVTSLAGLLTNTGNYYAFQNLPDATPSVVEALNVLNAQIGNRDYTSPLLVDGQSITASINALAAAISGASVLRVIERLTTTVDANTAHSLPGGNTYTVDGTYQGLNMDVFWRGVLRDPGPASTPSNSYEETSTTQITPYEKIKAGDSINYMIRN